MPAMYARMKKINMAAARRVTLESSSAGSWLGPSFWNISETDPQNSTGSKGLCLSCAVTSSVGLPYLLSMCTTTLDRYSLLFRERAMGTMEKTERARVMTPIMSPPVLRFTQQQHLWKHGMLSAHNLLITLLTVVVVAQCSPC